MSSQDSRTTSGFTLVELLVVVLVIGILASMAIPQYFKIVEKGRMTEAIGWMAELSTQQLDYLSKNGTYFSCTGGNLCQSNGFNADGSTNSNSPFNAVLPGMKDFNLGTVGGGNSITANYNGFRGEYYIVYLQRIPPCSYYYGCYEISFDSAVRGYQCSAGGEYDQAGNCTNVTADLLP